MAAARILDRATHSGPWATVDFEIGQPDHEVNQAGDRALWEEVKNAYVQWLKWGRPDITRFGITIIPTAHMVWLDEPDNVLQRAARPCTAS